MFCSFAINAQQTRYQWVKSVGGDNIAGLTGPYNQIMIDMSVDKRGNTYISGMVDENVTFGDSILHKPNGSFGSFDGMLAKYDKCGRLVWKQLAGGRSDDNFGTVLLSSDENYFISEANLFGHSYDSITLHLQNGDTIIKSNFYAYLKVNTTNGRILKMWPSLICPGGGIYYIDNPVFLSPNRLACFIQIQGNYNGVSKTGYETLIAILDSNLNIVRTRQLDSNMVYYTAIDYGFGHVPLTLDKYGNIYSGVILQPSNPSNVLHLFDTAFNGFAHGDGVLFQLDSNLNLKRFKRTNAIPTIHIAADDNLYVTGGADTNYYYDHTRFYGNGTNNRQMPIYIKLDTSLELKGYSYPVYDQYVQDMNLIKATTDKVYVAGLGFGNFKWGLDSINSIPNEYQISLWEFPKDSVRPTKVHLTDGFGINTAFPVYIGTDEQGNVSIGGTYGLALYTAADSVYAAGGMNSPNLYTLHWGLDCADSSHSLIAPLEPTALVATASSAHAVQVTWQDASRYENSFHIYRSPDGVSGWTRIDTVLANTTQYIDVNVQPHTAYWYRVAAWNENGESSFTNIDSALTWMDVGIAETDATLPYVNAYPNPTTDRLTIDAYSKGAKDATIQMIDINGRVVMSDQWSLSEGLNSKEMQTGGLTLGIYFLSIQTGSDIVTRKISKMN